MRSRIPSLGWLNTATRSWLVAVILLCSVFFETARAGGPITSGQTVNGTLSSPGFSEAWTFNGTNGNRVIITAVTTSGAVNTVIKLRNPSNVEVVSTGTDRVDYQLLATGTYTLTIEDSGLNDSGTYDLSFLNVTAGPLTSGADPDGGTIASTEVKTGQISPIADLDAFTFSGTAGDRINLGCIATGGSGFNTSMTLYPPGGGPAEVGSGGGDQLDIQLAATGTYTLVIEHNNDAVSGTYSLSLLNVTAGPWSSGADPDGGIIASADVKTGTFGTTPDFDAFRFTGTTGHRIVLACVLTSGSANTVTYLYPPSGGPAVVATGTDRNEFVLTATGTWTIVVVDSGLDTTGGYGLTLLDLSGPLSNGADPDGGAIASTEVKTGQISPVPDLDAFTFSGTAGDRINLGCIATGGSGFNTSMTLYPPGGGPAEVGSGGGDQLDIQLAATGTYTLVIEHNNDAVSGTYSLSLLNVTAGPWSSGADPDGGIIASADVKTGTFGTTPDFDAFRFTGTTGHRIVLACVLTSGSANTVTYLYPPSGGAAVVATGTDRNEFVLTATGTWTIVVVDSGLDTSGGYGLTLLDLSGPLSNGADPDGGAIASTEVKTGQISPVPDLDAFTFSGTAGDRINLGCIATGGSGFNTSMTLYPPGGGPAEVGSGGGDQLDIQLAATGTYTLVIEHNNDAVSGTYSLSLLNVTAGPWSSGADPDGGNIASADVETGTFGTTPDFDAFRFSGSNGDRVILTAVLTSGSANTVTYLYPPSGGPAVVATGTDRNEFVLNASGTWTIVVIDSGLDTTGSYNVSLLNLTSGPLSNGTDPDGGAITSAQWKSGLTNLPADLDAFTFDGVAGHRVLIAGIATGGASFNTTLRLYPPNGGAAEVGSGGGDRTDWQLGATGTYTLVIEDASDVNIGSYALTFVDLASGPFTSGGDPNGGTIFTGSALSGTITPAPDFDGWTFSGAVGDTVKVSAIATSGTINTQISIFPPSGGPAVVSTAVDNVTYVLTAAGSYTLVIEDNGLTDTGNYNLTFYESGQTTDVPADGTPGVDRIAVGAAYPNPFRGSSTLALATPREVGVQVRIFDARGALVRTLFEGRVAAGSHLCTWDGRDDRGHATPSGSYFAEIVLGDTAMRQRLVRVR